MPRFVVGHATHPDWQGALALAAAQIDGQRDGGTASLPHTGSLGLAYFSDHFAPQAEALHEALRARWPGVVWAGTVGIGVCASGVEYFDEPALVVMLTDLEPAHFRVFSGAQPLCGIEPGCGLGEAGEHRAISDGAFEKKRRTLRDLQRVELLCGGTRARFDFG